jgi:mycothiol synthase
MNLRADLELRPPTLDDLPQLATLSARLREVYDAGAPSEAELRDLLTSSHTKPEENYRVAVDAREHLVGWVTAWCPEGGDRIIFNLQAHPRESAIYEVLLAWTDARAGDASRPLAFVNAASDNDVLAELLRRRGYELARHFFRMTIALDRDVPDPAWPDRIDVRTFEAGDERAVFDADMDAFRDHWGFFEVPFEDWHEHFISSSVFDPTLWFLAFDGSELAGFSLCWNERRPNTGHVGVLGVRRRWRRRGLATALLQHSFQEFRSRGRAAVDLSVDGENISGAVAVYERAGMRVTQRDDAYQRVLE